MSLRKVIILPFDHYEALTKKKIDIPNKEGKGNPQIETEKHTNNEKKKTDEIQEEESEKKKTENKIEITDQDQLSPHPSTSESMNPPGVPPVVPLGLPPGVPSRAYISFASRKRKHKKNQRKSNFKRKKRIKDQRSWRKLWQKK